MQKSRIEGSNRNLTMNPEKIRFVGESDPPIGSNVEDHRVEIGEAALTPILKFTLRVNLSMPENFPDF